MGVNSVIKDFFYREIYIFWTPCLYEKNLQGHHTQAFYSFNILLHIKTALNIRLDTLYIYCVYEKHLKGSSVYAFC